MTPWAPPNNKICVHDVFYAFMAAIALPSRSIHHAEHGAGRARQKATRTQTRDLQLYIIIHQPHKLTMLDPSASAK